MPDSNITLEDVYKELIKLEVMLQERLPQSASEVDKNSPYWNPEKQSLDMAFYRKNHPKDERAL
jgi:hypothetical protein